MSTITPRKGQTFQVPSTIVTLRAVAADTGDAFSLFDCRVAPRQGPPLHRHQDNEAFLVLEGAFDFTVGDEQRHLGPGGFVFVPAQTPHTYLNRSAAHEGRLLVITLPAGAHELFFAEVGEPEADPSAPFSTQPPDFEKLITTGTRYGIEILLPSS